MHFYRRWQPVAAISFDLDDTLYDNGPAIVRAEQWMLGHASIASTQVYTHLDFQHLASVYDKAHPRSRR